MKQKTLLLIITLLSSLTDSAQTLINGIYYDDFNLSAKTVKVSKNPNKYSGSVVIPSTIVYRSSTYNVTEIGDSAFCDCTGLTSVSISNSVKTIGREAFYYCTNLTSVSIPNGVETIGYYAFGLCESLTSVSIPNSVKTIGESAFEECSGLISVVIPNSVTSIGSWAFFGCTNITSVSIPNSVKTIGNDAFNSCWNLRSIAIPNSVKSIGGMAFSNCSELTSISVESGNKVYDSRNNCNAIIETSSNTLIAGCKNTVIPNNVTAIGDDAFFCCSDLTSITIPNSVTCIGESAFRYCSDLSSVTIGNSVTSIGDNAFSDCSDLRYFYCYAEKVPTTGRFYPFLNSPISSATLYVPEISINTYKATEPWSGFSAFEALTMPKCATPTISFVDGRVTFSCETEGVEFVSKVTCSDNGDYEGASVSFSNQYTVSVYAKKTGYENSDITTKEIEVSGASAVGIKGDVNEDGKVNGTDIQEVINIIVNGSDEDETASLSCPDDNHPHMIDLGLPSGTKWACCNVGASKPEEYGNYYAWGETSTKSMYTTDTYLFYDSSTNTYFDLGRDIAGTKYDAATANWGASWCMPNWKQCYELEKETTSELTMVNGVNGRKFTGKNGKSIFLPAAGGHLDNGPWGVGAEGGYRSSEEENCDGCAGVMGFASNCEKCLDIAPLGREEGWTVRPVRK